MQIFKNIQNIQNTQQKRDLELKAAVSNALEQWHIAREYFENVDDPALIDYAIYHMEAARRKYIYMLNEAKERRVI